MPAVQIATFGSSSTTSGAKLEVDVLKRIVEENGLENLPIVPVAVAGNARTGKTFSLNFMVELLEYMSKSLRGDFKDSRSIISGMDWAGGPDGVTKGMWLWEKPFIIEREDGSKFAILLIDTQGIGDGIYSADPQVDKQIIYLALSMTTIYIHNVDRNWKHSERMIYQICKSFKDLFGEDNQSGKNLFNSFTLLFRNWVHDEVYGLRSEIFNNEVRKAREHIEASKILDGIDKLFSHKTAWVLPEPSETVRRCQGGSIAVSEIGQDFQKYLEEFTLELISDDGIYSQHTKSALTGGKFIELLEDLSDRLEDWPDLTREEDQLKDIYLSRAYQSAKEIFENELKAVIGHDDIAVINDLLGKAEHSGLHLFKQRSHKVRTADKFYSHYYEKLLKEIKQEKQLCKAAAEVRIAHKKLEKSEKEKKEFEEKMENLRQTMQEMNKTSKWDKVLRTLDTVSSLASLANMGLMVSNLYTAVRHAPTAAHAATEAARGIYIYVRSRSTASKKGI